jgi:hypothetical protein
MGACSQGFHPALRLPTWPQNSATAMADGANLYIEFFDSDYGVSSKSKTKEIRVMPQFSEDVEIQNGDLILKDAEGNNLVHLRTKGEGAEGIRQIFEAIDINGHLGSINIGGDGKTGTVMVKDSGGSQTIFLDGATGLIRAGNDAQEGNETIRLNGQNGNITLGGNGQDGDIFLQDNKGNGTISIGGGEQNLLIKMADGKKVIELSIDVRHFANLLAGGNGYDGRILLYPKSGDVPAAETATIALDAGGGNVWLGGNGADGDLVLKDQDDVGRIHLTGGGGQTDKTARVVINGSEGAIRAGDNGKDGNILVRNAKGELMIHLDGQSGDITLGDKQRIRLTSGGNAWLGGNGDDGDLVLFPSNVTDTNDLSKASIHLDGQSGDITLGDKQRIRLTSGGNAWLGGNGADGDLVLFPSNVTDTSDLSKASIRLDGQSGDIILQNADCAEDFDVAVDEKIEPGTVLVIEQDDRLRQSTEAYDKRVAGVVSGAGDYKPGIVLDKKPTRGKRLPVALMGKVYCKVDAQYSPVETGDLLTTSPTPGHAMKASDPLKAFGAVIGKALRPLQEGTSLIPVLVALQ